MVFILWRAPTLAQKGLRGGQVTGEKVFSRKHLQLSACKKVLLIFTAVNSFSINLRRRKVFSISRFVRFLNNRPHVLLSKCALRDLEIRANVPKFTFCERNWS